MSARQTMLDAAVPAGSTTVVASLWFATAGPIGMCLATTGDLHGTWTVELSNNPRVQDGGFDDEGVDVTVGLETASGDPIAAVTGASSQYCQIAGAYAGSMRVLFTPTSGTGRARVHISAPFGHDRVRQNISRTTILDAQVTGPGQVSGDWATLLAASAISFHLVTTGDLQGEWKILAACSPFGAPARDEADITAGFETPAGDALAAVTGASKQFVQSDPFNAGEVNAVFVRSSGIGTARAHILRAA